MPTTFKELFFIILIGVSLPGSFASTPSYVSDSQIFGFCGQTFVTLGLQREKAGRAGLAIYTSVFFAIILELFIFHTLPSFLSLVGVSIILTSAAWVAVSPCHSGDEQELMERYKRKHQTSHPGMRKHFPFQELLHPYPRPISDLRVVENIIRIRQFQLRRKHISVRRVGMGRVRVDQHCLFRGMQGLVSICIAYSASYRFHHEYTYRLAVIRTRLC